MQRVSPEQEARALRESARQIRRHVEHVCSSVAWAEMWLAVAAAREQLADALTLPPLGAVRVRKAG